MATKTLQENLNEANPNKLADALRKVRLGDIFRGPFVETLVVGTDHKVTLARPAALIENVFDDTDSASLDVVPASVAAAVDDSVCTIEDDTTDAGYRKVLTFHANEDGNTVVVSYLASDVDVTEDGI